MTSHLKRLLVNAVGLRAGGGPTVGLNVLARLRGHAPDLRVRALIPAQQSYVDVCEANGFEYRVLSAKRRGYAIWRMWFDQHGVNSEARSFGADAIFSMGNLGPWHPHAPHVILFHNSYYIYASSEWGGGWSRTQRVSLAAQRWVFAKCVRTASFVAAQTDVAANRLIEQYDVPQERVAVIPSAVSLDYLNTTPSDALGIGERARGRTVVGVVSRYYPHKQIDAVVDCAARLRAADDDRFMLVLTIEPSDHAGAARVLERIRNEGLQDLVMNVGFIPLSSLASLYAQLSVLLLPSRLESMSSTYMEAMVMGVPIVTSDRDFAHGTCGPAALYVDPDEPQSWIAAIASLADDPAIAERLVTAGRERIAALDVNYDTVAVAYLTLLERAASGERPVHAGRA